MAVDRDVGAAQPAAVDDRRVVQLVGAHERARSADGREHAEVGGEAGGEEGGAIRVLPFGERAFEIGVTGARADDQARRTRARAPAVERGVRRRDDGGMLRSGRGSRWTRTDTTGPWPASAPSGRARIEVARRSPLSAARIALRSPSAHASPGHCRARSGRHSSSIASDNASTIRRNSGEVIVSGGISTTVSPNGRRSTPRSVACALTSPAPPQTVGRWRELDAAHKPSQADLFHRRLGARCDRAAALAVRRIVRERLRARPTLRSTRDAGAQRPPQVRSRRRSGRGRASAARDRRRGTRRTRGHSPPSPTSRGSPRSCPCPGTAGRVVARIAPMRTACRCARIRLRPRRRSTRRRGRGTRRRARQGRRIGELHAGRALHERLNDDGREVARVLRRRVRSRGRSSQASAKSGAREHRETQRVEDLGTEPPIAE